MVELRAPEGGRGTEAINKEICVKRFHEGRGALVGNTPVTGDYRGSAGLKKSLRGAEHAFARQQATTRCIAGAQYDEARGDTHVEDIQQAKRAGSAARGRVLRECKGRKSRSIGIHVAVRGDARRSRLIAAAARSAVGVASHPSRVLTWPDGEDRRGEIRNREHFLATAWKPG